MADEMIVLIEAAGNVEDDENYQREISAEYDPSCKLVQFVQYDEEVFGTLEPITPEEWGKLVERFGLPTTLAALADFATKNEGDLAIGFGKGHWSVALTWGREAPDSPMAGAQALGAADTLEEALGQVTAEARIVVPGGRSSG